MYKRDHNCFMTPYSLSTLEKTLKVWPCSSSVMKARALTRKGESNGKQGSGEKGEREREKKRSPRLSKAIAVTSFVRSEE